MKKFLFIDRDGTLIREPADQQVDSLEKFALLPGVIPALLRLTKARYSLIMVSNQDGLGSTSYPQASFDLVQRLMLGIFSSQGVNFDEILICPHLPIDACQCRKPQTLLVHSYLASNEMDRENSYVVGDRQSDLQLAQNMGLKAHLISDSLGWPEISHLILDQPRVAEIKRNTSETRVGIRVDLDGQGRCSLNTGVGFFDHMLEQLARHGGFDLAMESKGDLHIDEHHLVEDVALTLGLALRKALGDKRGIQRYGFWLPMDEADTRVTIDLSGRAFCVVRGEFPAGKVGEMSIEMVPHFFRSLADSLAMSLHIETRGSNTHHMVESIFKGVGRSLALAFKRDQGLIASVPSTKGSL